MGRITNYLCYSFIVGILFITSYRPDLVVFPPEPVSPVVPEVSLFSPVLRVTIKLNNTNRTMCSAFIISQSIAMTSAHCIISNMIQSLSNQNKTHFQGLQVVSKDIDRDIAILKGDFSKYKSFKLLLGKSGFEEFNKTYTTCGYPYGGKLICNKTMILSNQITEIRGTGIIMPGMSGGPVFDTETMEVYCVNKAVFQGFSSCAPLVNILEWLGIIPEE